MKTATMTGVLVIFVLALALSCGQKADDQTATLASTDDAAERATRLSYDGPDFSKFGEHEQDAREIWFNVYDTIERLRYGDKSGLYDNELEYMREEKTYDDYLLHGEVAWANADSLDHIEITDIIFYDRDSALVDADFFMLSSTGDVYPSPIRWTAYYREGRWIKPYLSRLVYQLELEEMIRQADEDASEDW